MLGLSKRYIQVGLKLILEIYIKNMIRAKLVTQIIQYETISNIIFHREHTMLTKILIIFFC